MRAGRLGFMAVMAVGLAAGWVGTGAAVGPPPAERCEARKLDAAGAKADVVLGKTPNFAKCSDGFAEAFANAEAKAGPGVCPTEGDAAAIEAQIDACVDRLAAALSSATPPATYLFPATGQTISYTAGDDGDIEAGATLSYTDNGDGTITDNNTGLMWAKKDDNNVDSLHDKDTTYTWANAFAVHITGLNAGAGFAGYADWRLPNVKELQSIVNWQNVTPAVSSAFNTGCAALCTVQTCSCTAGGAGSVHWSSTSYVINTPNAWFVHFGNDHVDNLGKGNTFVVRAVRGGL